MFILLFFNLIPNKHLFIPNEKGKYGIGSKNSCENYLFKDYCLKSGVAIWDLSLRKEVVPKQGKERR
jgi:hypothetical protein